MGIGQHLNINDNIYMGISQCSNINNNINQCRSMCYGVCSKMLHYTGPMCRFCS